MEEFPLWINVFRTLYDLIFAFLRGFFPYNYFYFEDTSRDFPDTFETH